MRFRAALLRILRASAISLLSLILLAFAFVQFNQYLLRYRAKHLLADFHSLRLKQSTWPDAQRLISRWGAFGNYYGTCTAKECSYSILLEDQGSKINSRLYDFMEARWPQSYSGITFARIYIVLGGRGARMRMGLLVRNSVIERSSIAVAVDVPQRDLWCDWDCPGGGGYELLLSARASQSLKPIREKGRWIAGDDEQLVQHPDYKVGRPDGCEVCMSGEVTFTPYASRSDIDSLTSYNLACFTPHFHPCRILADVLPLARVWRLYPEAEGVPEPADPPGPPQPCDIPIRTLGRDATSVLELKVLSVGTQKEPPDTLYPSGRAVERDKVQIVAKLKGAEDWPLNATTDAMPYAWDINFPWQAAEHLETGKSFIVTLDSEYGPETLLNMPRCGVHPDSPDVRAELAKGFAQNDGLPQKEELWGGVW